MLVVTALPNVRLWLWLGSVITSLAVHGGGKVAELRAASREPAVAARPPAPGHQTSTLQTQDQSCKRAIGEESQSQRIHLLGPSPR